MKGLNRAYLIGNLGQEPELRTAASGAVVLKLSLATPNSRKVNDTWVDTPDWHRVTAFGSDAEFLARNAHKGDTLAVECAIRPNKWTDKDGVVRYDVSLIIDRIAWLGSRNRAQPVEPREHGEGREPGARRAAEPRRNEPPPVLDEAEEIPF